ncbi:AMP-dependent synthetase and ligase family protein [Salix suchowensis]|nr:AMP-dependent synthetase and ligase family protein [Salix suchowensis]
MPYAYIHEFIRTSMAGKIRRFKGGYTSLWQKISKSLPIEVHCKTEVLAVRRNSDSVSVDVKRNNGEFQEMQFDKIIISGSFPFRNGNTYRSPAEKSAESETEVMDIGEVERYFFSKVQTIDYYTTVLKIIGLEDMPVGFYYFGEYMDEPATIGHPVAMQKFFADTDIFLFWSYGNSFDIKGPTVAELAKKAVMSMGAKVEEVVLQRRFKYFPHVGSQEMKGGFYDKLESELQGQRNTFYVGGLMAFELTERNSSYAMALSLLSLKSDCWDRSPKELGDGVEFPDLSKLDGSLKHWGTENVTKDKTLYSWIGEDGAVSQGPTSPSPPSRSSAKRLKALYGAAHLRSTELYSSPEGKQESGSALVTSFGLGILAALASVAAKWILVEKKKPGQTIHIWSTGVFMDTVWPAFRRIRTVVGDYFMEMISGSILFLLWLKLMGSHTGLDQGAYVDSMGAALNPEMVEIERGGCVGREALLFGHIYEGEGGRVKFGKIRVGEGGFIGRRAISCLVLEQKEEEISVLFSLP